MRTCLFCAATKLTKEHIWPDWIVTLAKGERQDFTGTLTRSTGKIETWTQPTITHKARLLCKECNNVKMGSIEDHIKPLLGPLISSARSRSLDAADQFSLATWFVVRSMIWDQLDRKLGTPYYTQDERIAFSDREPVAIPSNTHIWIATYAGPPGRFAFNVTNWLVSESNRAHCITAVMNQVILQILTWTGEQWRLAPASDVAEGHARHIWPIRYDAIDWPLSGQVSRGGLHSLSKRFRAGDTPVRGLDP